MRRIKNTYIFLWFVVFENISRGIYNYLYINITRIWRESDGRNNIKKTKKQIS